MKLRYLVPCVSVALVLTACSLIPNHDKYLEYSPPRFQKDYVRDYVQGDAVVTFKTEYEYGILFSINLNPPQPTYLSLEGQKQHFEEYRKQLKVYTKEVNKNALELGVITYYEQPFGFRAPTRILDPKGLVINLLPDHEVLIYPYLASFNIRCQPQGILLTPKPNTNYVATFRWKYPYCGFDIHPVNEDGTMGLPETKRAPVVGR